MANAILAKLGTSTQLTITLNSLASSTVGVGRQSTMVDNTSDRFQFINLHIKVKTGTSPTASKGIYVYLLKGNKASTPDVITDGAGASDAGLTVASAQQIAGAATSSTTGQVYQFDCVINYPGPSWGIAIVQDTAVALDASAGGSAWFEGMNQEVQ